ncbi:MAG TPA: N-6 DNA methylase [Thermoanaerobaculia bacterium]|nr:N-6 DNA methylase [Thermoanaerobaculia bacterium]
MITAADLRTAASDGDCLPLLRALGYPIQPVDIDSDAWRRAGIDVAWNGEATLRLVSRMRRFDLFVLEGTVSRDLIARFLRSYRHYNVLTKSVVIHASSRALSIFDLSDKRELRRLDVDLQSPGAHSVDRLNLLAIEKGDGLQPLVRIFDRALDRESLGRRFFERFRLAVNDLEAALAAQCPGAAGELVRGEALLILSRLLFLQFVQVKGWLNGERRFLVDRLERCMESNEEYFTAVIQPLFFGCLNTPAERRDERARALGRIPYLNGGLFEPSAFERRYPHLRVKNSLMRDIIEELFERFSFSVDESDSAGVHIDPEMLGKVFESLMEAEERAASGSFYTPKEIVDDLAGAAIAEWLSEGDAVLRRRLIGIALPGVHPTLARSLLEKLQQITVLDPACGSGAFLLSCLNIIERLTRRLSDIAAVPVERDLRQQIAERSLFGVDLKMEAVRLCELRIWLAIVSTCDLPLEEIPPLPNLDRNVMQGNSLLSPTDFLGDTRLDVYRDWITGIRAQRDLIERYRTGSSAERPAFARMIRTHDCRLAADLLRRSIEVDEEELRALLVPRSGLFPIERNTDASRMRELQQRVIHARRLLADAEEERLDFFSFDVHFAPLLERGGFDVVLGNPPWVRNSRIDPRIKRMLMDRYSFFRPGEDRAAFHQPDLSLAFFERSLSLADRHGVVAMLMPSKVLSAAYASRFRAAVHRLSIAALTDWSSSPRRHFQADTFPLSVTVSKRMAKPRQVAVSTHGESHLVEAEGLMDPRSQAWTLAPRAVTDILTRLRQNHLPLSEALGRSPIMGVKTGNNDRFFIDVVEFRNGEAVTSDGVAIPLTAVCRCARGRDVRRWSVAASEWMVWPPRERWREAPSWLKRLAAARGTDPDSFRLSYVRPEHIGVKVAWKDVSRGMAAAVLPDMVSISGYSFPLVPNQTLYAIDAVSPDDAYAVAALLNSTVFEALVLSIAERAKDAHFRYFGRTIARTPCPSLERPADFSALVRLSRRAHAGGEAASELDQIVASLYGVTASEFATLSRYVEQLLGRHSR